MTAITLNLLAEERLAQKAEARDPFKFAMAIGISLLTASVITGMWLGHLAAAKKSAADALQIKWEQLSETQTTETGSDYKTLKALSDDIIAANHARQLYAQQLALVKDLVPNSVQLTRIAFRLSLDAPPPPPPEAVAPDKTDSSKNPRVLRLQTTESLRVQIEGQAVSARPEIEVDRFIQALREDAEFGKRVKDIKLQSIARAAAAPDAAVTATPMASFVIECQYKERK